jgi:hypothetical protein
MSAVIPIITSGSTPATLAVGVYRQLLVENLDAVNAMTVSWNGSVGAWQLKPGTRLGLVLIGGVTTVSLSDAIPGNHALYQVLQQG